MDQLIFAFAISVAFFGCMPGQASKYSFDELLDSFANVSHVENVPMVFHGLPFSIDNQVVNCWPENPTELNCDIKIKNNAGLNLAQAQLVFKKLEISSQESLPLVRLMRKEQWRNQYPLINQYVEKEFNAGDFITKMQTLRYFKLDNINWPVLISAFDVVLNNRTGISVTIVCDASDWPTIKEKTDEIFHSFSRAANK